MLLLENDTSSFHAYSRSVPWPTLYSSSPIKEFEQLTDSNTHSVWNQRGVCISGTLKDVQLGNTGVLSGVLAFLETVSPEYNAIQTNRNMAYIQLNNQLPGITGLLENRVDTAAPIRELTQILLRGMKTH